VDSHRAFDLLAGTVEPPILHGLGDVRLVNLSDFIEIGQ
jgi:hypothetical protein